MPRKVPFFELTGYGMDLNFKALSNGVVSFHTITKKLDHTFFKKRHFFSKRGRKCNFLGGVGGNAVIKKFIMDGKPFMAARHGRVELNYVINDLDFDRLCFNAGFFPRDRVSGMQFKTIYEASSRSLDILSIWNYRHGFYLAEQNAFFNYSPQAELADLSSLSPFLFDDPWSAALKGKRVLVIHPFSETIEAQYFKREHLFSNPYVLPEFKSLKVLKAIQSVAGTRPPFDDWFDALAFMKDRIVDEDFDIALIGCGCYGLPIAAFVKSIGKQAIHIGGALQLLFGIKGKRWETEYDYDEIFYNEYWVRPSDEDKPKNFEMVEGGCYW